MFPPSLIKKQTGLALGLILVLFSLFALWIRLIPMAGLTAGGFADVLGNDPWYNLRQVESLIANGLTYAWYEPMTLYPTGQVVHWGPLFPQIIAGLAILTGATTRPEIAFVASLVPPLMGAAMVPLIFLIGRRVADSTTGILAALFAAVISGQYLYRSLFGFADHHVAEVLFSTLFALAYIVALSRVREEKVDLSSIETLKRPLLLGALAGVAYLLGLFVMPTMILFALIAAVYTLLQCVLDAWHGRESTDIAVINTAVFLVATLGLLVFGIQHEGLGLARYSMGHVVAYLAVVVATWVLIGVARATKGRPKYLYPLSLAGLGIIGAIALMVATPALYEVLVGNFFGFFGQPVQILTVQEAMPWSFEGAWQAFNVGLLLMIGGFAVLIYELFRKDRPDYLFVIVWSAVMLASTVQHVRYEYYLAANIALLAGIFVGFVVSAGWKDVQALASSPAPEKTEAKGRKKADAGKAPARKGDARNVLAVAGVALVSLVFVVMSVQSGMAVAEASGYGGMNPQWRQALDWMAENTPETGVDYYGIYEKETFEYPETAYGVMSWWDYGHYITYLAKRIPVSNPFQSGVTGPNGSAAFFMQQEEAAAAEIMENTGTRYVITDIEMDTGKFWAMATWYNPDVAQRGYLDTYLIQDSGSYSRVQLNTPAYYRTMVSRLHNFDGSMASPTQVVYIEYTEAGASGFSAPVITNAMMLNWSEAKAKAEAYNANAPAGKAAGLFGTDNNLTLPPEEVSALRHFRLVFESSRNVYNAVTPDIKYVKVFEYVQGARIAGEGTIEVDLKANTGRTFTYRQESVNGEFVVPYSTSGNPYGVTAAGPYRIVGTGQTIEVSEDAVMQGLRVN